MSTPAFCVVVYSPPAYAHAAAFAEVAQMLVYGIRAAGYTANVYHNAVPPACIPILLGGNLWPLEWVDRLPAQTVIFNLEQISADSPWMKTALPALVARFETWDYSQRNGAQLAQLVPGAAPRWVPITYVPELSHIAALPPDQEDIDVLFYGSVNPRREAILTALRAQGLNVVHAFNVYGPARDALIARAKVVLNLHLYPAKIFEVVRVSYLLANRKAVVAEGAPETECYPGIESAVCLVPYEQLVAACVALVGNASARAALAKAGYAWMSARAAVPILAPELKRLAAAWQAPVCAPVPRKLALSLPVVPEVDCLYLDQGPTADVEVNLLHSFPFEQTFETMRFGAVRLAARTFDMITLGDWPARVPDWLGLLRACAQLLTWGGRLHCTVPFALSASAWDDPRTIRTFTETSFDCLATAHIDFEWPGLGLYVIETQAKLSPYGQTLAAEGAALPILLRTPRAVVSLMFTLGVRTYSPLPERVL